MIGSGKMQAKYCKMAKQSVFLLCLERSAKPRSLKETVSRRDLSSAEGLEDDDKRGM